MFGQVIGWAFDWAAARPQFGYWGPQAPGW